MEEVQMFYLVKLFQQANIIEPQKSKLYELKMIVDNNSLKIIYHPQKDIVEINSNSGYIKYENASNLQNKEITLLIHFLITESYKNQINQVFQFVILKELKLNEDQLVKKNNLIKLQDKFIKLLESRDQETFNQQLEKFLKNYHDQNWDMIQTEINVILQKKRNNFEIKENSEEADQEQFFLKELFQKQIDIKKLKDQIKDKQWKSNYILNHILYAFPLLEQKKSIERELNKVKEIDEEIQKINKLIMKHHKDKMHPIKMNEEQEQMYERLIGLAGKRMKNEYSSGMKRTQEEVDEMEFLLQIRYNPFDIQKDIEDERKITDLISQQQKYFILKILYLKLNQNVIKQEKSLFICLFKNSLEEEDRSQQILQEKQNNIQDEIVKFQNDLIDRWYQDDRQCSEEIQRLDQDKKHKIQEKQQVRNIRSKNFCDEIRIKVNVDQGGGYVQSQENHRDCSSGCLYGNLVNLVFEFCLDQQFVQEWELDEKFSNYVHSFTGDRKHRSDILKIPQLISDGRYDLERDIKQKEAFIQNQITLIEQDIKKIRQKKEDLGKWIKQKELQQNQLSIQQYYQELLVKNSIYDLLQKQKKQMEDYLEKQNVLNEHLKQEILNKLDNLQSRYEEIQSYQEQIRQKRKDIKTKEISTEIEFDFQLRKQYSYFQSIVSSLSTNQNVNNEVGKIIEDQYDYKLEEYKKEINKLNKNLNEYNKIKNEKLIQINEAYNNWKQLKKKEFDFDVQNIQMSYLEDIKMYEEEKKFIENKNKKITDFLNEIHNKTKIVQRLVFQNSDLKPINTFYNKDEVYSNQIFQHFNLIKFRNHKKCDDFEKNCKFNELINICIVELLKNEYVQETYLINTYQQRFKNELNDHKYDFHNAIQVVKNYIQQNKLNYLEANANIQNNEQYNIDQKLNKLKGYNNIKLKEYHQLSHKFRIENETQVGNQIFPFVEYFNNFCFDEVQKQQIKNEISRKNVEIDLEKELFNCGFDQINVESDYQEVNNFVNIQKNNCIKEKNINLIKRQVYTKLVECFEKKTIKKLIDMKIEDANQDINKFTILKISQQLQFSLEKKNEFEKHKQQLNNIKKEFGNYNNNKDNKLQMIQQDDNDQHNYLNEVTTINDLYINKIKMLELQKENSEKENERIQENIQKNNQLQRENPLLIQQDFSKFNNEIFWKYENIFGIVNNKSIICQNEKCDYKESLKKVINYILNKVVQQKIQLENPYKDTIKDYLDQTIICHLHNEELKRVANLTYEFIYIKQKEKELNEKNINSLNKELIHKNKRYINYNEQTLIKIQSKQNLIQDFLKFQEKRAFKDKNDDDQKYHELIEREQQQKNENMKLIRHFYEFKQKQLNNQEKKIFEDCIKELDQININIQSSKKRRKHFNSIIEVLNKIKNEIQTQYNQSKNVNNLVEDFNNWKNSQEQQEHSIDNIEQATKKLEELKEKRKALILEDLQEQKQQFQDINDMLDFLENKEQICLLRQRNEDIQNIQYSRQSYYSLMLDNDEVISINLKSKDEFDQPNEVKDIIKTKNKLNYFDEILLNKKILYDKTIDEIKEIEKSNSEKILSQYERYLLINGYLLCSLVKWSDGSKMSKDEQLVASIISFMFDEFNLYQSGEENMISLENDYRTKSILKKLKKDKDIPYIDILDIINKEFEYDKMRISEMIVNYHDPSFKQVKLVTNNYLSNNFNRNWKECKIEILFMKDQYFVFVKSKCIRESFGDPFISIQLEKNYVLNRILKQDLMENLFLTRLKKIYKLNLNDTQKFDEVYSSEKLQLKKVFKFTDFISEMLQVYYLQEIVEETGEQVGDKMQRQCLLHYISWLVNSIKYQHDQNLGDSDEKQIIEIIKRKYIYTIFEVIKNEQQRRQEQNRNSQQKLIQEQELNNQIIIQEEEELQEILKEIQNKQNTIDQNSQKMGLLIGRINDAEKTYKFEKEKLQNIMDEIKNKIKNENNKLQQIISKENKNDQKINLIVNIIKDLEQQSQDIQNKIEGQKKQLEFIEQQKNDLQYRMKQQELDKKSVQIEKKRNEEEAKKKQDEINLNTIISKFIQNLRDYLSSPNAIKISNEVKKEFQRIKDLDTLIQNLEAKLGQDWNILMEDIDKQEFKNLLKHNYNTILGETKEDLFKRISCIFFSSIRREFGMIQQCEGNRIVRIFKMEASSLATSQLLKDLFDTLKLQVREKYNGFYFSSDQLNSQNNPIYLKSQNYQYFSEFDSEIYKFFKRRMELKLKYEDVLAQENNSNFLKMNEKFNDLQIEFQDIIPMFLDEIQIVCSGSFAIDQDFILNGIDFSGIIRKICIKNQGAKINTSGKAGISYKQGFNHQALSGVSKRKNHQYPKGDKGYDSYHGCDGGNGGHIKLKIEDTIENEEDCFKFFESNGGDGQKGQLGGDGDEGENGEDGQDGEAEDTKGIGGPQTRFGFGTEGKKGRKGGSPGLTGLPGLGGKSGIIEIYKGGKKFTKQSKEGITAKNILFEKQPKGGQGGKGGKFGMDEVLDKKSFFHKTTRKITIVDREDLVKKNPNKYSFILKVPTAVVFLIPPLFIWRIIDNTRVLYEEKEESYLYRNMDKLKGDNYEEKAQLRNDDRSINQKHDSCGFEKLHSDMEYKNNEENFIFGTDMHNQYINEIKFDKEQIDIEIDLCDNKLNDIQSDLDCMQNEIQQKDQEMQTLSLQIQQLENQQEEKQNQKNQNINQAVQKIQKLQTMREEKGKQNLQIEKVIQKLNLYINQQDKFYDNKQCYKNLIQEYLQILKEGYKSGIKDMKLMRALFNKKQEDLQKNKKNLKELKEQNLQNQEVELEIQEEVQEEVEEQQELQLEQQIDYDDKIKQQMYKKYKKKPKICQEFYSTEKNIQTISMSSSKMLRKKEVHEVLKNALRHYRSGFYNLQKLSEVIQNLKADADISENIFQTELKSFKKQVIEINIQNKIQELDSLETFLLHEYLIQLQNAINRENLSLVRDKIPYIINKLQKIEENSYQLKYKPLYENLSQYIDYKLEINEQMLLKQIEDLIELIEKRSFIYFEKCAVNFGNAIFQNLCPKSLMTAMTFLNNEAYLEINLFPEMPNKDGKKKETLLENQHPKNKNLLINKIFILTYLVMNLNYDKFISQLDTSNRSSQQNQNSYDSIQYQLQIFMSTLNNSQQTPATQENDLDNSQFIMGASQNRMFTENNLVIDEINKQEIVNYLYISNKNFSYIVLTYAADFTKQILNTLLQIALSSKYHLIQGCREFKVFMDLIPSLQKKKYYRERYICEVAYKYYYIMSKLNINNQSNQLLSKDQFQINEYLIDLYKLCIKEINYNEKLFFIDNIYLKNSIEFSDYNELKQKLEQNSIEVNIEKQQLQQINEIKNNNQDIEKEITQYFNNKLLENDMLYNINHYKFQMIHSVKQKIILDLIMIYKRQQDIKHFISDKIKAFSYQIEQLFINLQQFLNQSNQYKKLSPLITEINKNQPFLKSIFQNLNKNYQQQIDYMKLINILTYILIRKQDYFFRENGSNLTQNEIKEAFNNINTQDSQESEKKKNKEQLSRQNDINYIKTKLLKIILQSLLYYFMIKIKNNLPDLQEMVNMDFQKDHAKINKEQNENQINVEIYQKLNHIYQILANIEKYDDNIKQTLLKIQEEVRDQEQYFSNNKRRIEIYEQIYNKLSKTIQSNNKYDFEELENYLKQIPNQNWQIERPLSKFIYQDVSETIQRQLKTCTQNDPFQLQLIYYYMKNIIKMDQNRVYDIYQLIENNKDEKQNILNLMMQFADKQQLKELVNYLQQQINDYYKKIYYEINQIKQSILQNIKQNCIQLALENQENQIQVYIYILNHLENLIIKQDYDQDILGKKRIDIFKKLDNKIEDINKQQNLEQEQKYIKIQEAIQFEIEQIVVIQNNQIYLDNQFSKSYFKEIDHSLIQTFKVNGKQALFVRLNELFDSFGKLNNDKFKCLVYNKYTLICNDTNNETYYRFLNSQNERYQENEEKLDQRIEEFKQLASHLFQNYKTQQLQKSIEKYNNSKSVQEIILVAADIIYFINKEGKQFQNGYKLDERFMKFLNSLSEIITFLVFIKEEDQRVLQSLRISLDLILNKNKSKNSQSQKNLYEYQIEKFKNLLQKKSWIPTQFIHIDEMKIESSNNQYYQLNFIQNECQKCLDEANQYIQNRSEFIQNFQNVKIKLFNKPESSCMFVRLQEISANLQNMNSEFLLKDLEIKKFNIKNIKDFINHLKNKDKARNTKTESLAKILKLIQNHFSELNEDIIQILLISLDKNYQQSYYENTLKVVNLYNQMLSNKLKLQCEQQREENQIEIGYIQQYMKSKIEAINSIIQAFLIFFSCFNKSQLNKQITQIKKNFSKLINSCEKIMSIQQNQQQIQEQVIKDYIYQLPQTGILSLKHLIKYVFDQQYDDLFGLLFLIPICEYQKDKSSLERIIKKLEKEIDLNVMEKLSPIFNISFRALIQDYQQKQFSKDVVEEMKGYSQICNEEEVQITIQNLKQNVRMQGYIQFLAYILLKKDLVYNSKNFIIDEYLKKYTYFNESNNPQKFLLLKKFMGRQESEQLTKIIEFQQSLELINLNKQINNKQNQKETEEQFVQQNYIQSNFKTLFNQLNKSSILQWKDTLIQFRFDHQIKPRLLKIYDQTNKEQFDEVIDQFYRYCIQNQLINEGLEILEQFCLNLQKFQSLQEISFSISQLINLRNFQVISQIFSNHLIHQQIGIEIMFSKLLENKDLKTTNSIRRLKYKLIQCKFNDVIKFCKHFISYAQKIKNLIDEKCQNIIELIIETDSFINNDLMNKILDNCECLEDWELVLSKELIQRGIQQSGFGKTKQVLFDNTIEIIYQIGKRFGKNQQNLLIQKIQEIQIKQSPYQEFNRLFNVLNQILYNQDFDYHLINKFTTNLDDWEKRVIQNPQNENQNNDQILDFQQLLGLMEQDNSINRSIKGVFEKYDRSKILLLLQILCKVNDRSTKQWYQDNYQNIYQIQKWAADFKNKQYSLEDLKWSNPKNTLNIQELLLIISRAVNIYDGYFPRDTQLLAVLLFLDSDSDDKGRLGNISTGEGKTLTTVILATCVCLVGKTVDVVTSSKILAIRDSKDREKNSKEGYKQFFKFFNLRVSNNCDPECETSISGDVTKEKRYQENEIMYGEASYFQRDYLLSNFYGKNIRKGLGDILILDEVDSMMIDNAARSLYISHVIPDLKYLKDLFILIWTCVNSATDNKFNKENVEKMHIFINECIRTGKDQITDGQTYLSNQNIKIIIPEEYHEFVQKNMDIWIESAYSARYISEDNSYIIGDDQSNKLNEIIIMDKDTGVEQTSSKWSNGLHQFLQLKHSSQMSEESLKAIFISNIGYFKMYSKLFGMTGTLGDNQERDLLYTIYKTKFFEIPRFKKYLFNYDFNCQSVSKTVEEWLQKIINNINQNFEQNKVDCNVNYQQQMLKRFNELKNQQEKCQYNIQKVNNQILFYKLIVGLYDRYSSLYNKLFELPKNLLIWRQLIKDDEFKQGIKDYIQSIILNKENLYKKYQNFIQEICDNLNRQQAKPNLNNIYQRIKIQEESFKLGHNQIFFEQEIKIIQDNFQNILNLEKDKSEFDDNHKINIIKSYIQEIKDELEKKYQKKQEMYEELQNYLQEILDDNNNLIEIKCDKVKNKFESLQFDKIKMQLDKEIKDLNQ